MKQLILFSLCLFKGFLFAQDNSEANRLGFLLYPEMVFVEGGSFIMGDNWGMGSEDELPTHEVSLKSFKISKTEVTVKQYRQFCVETGRFMPIAPSWGWKDRHPIINVTYNDAVSYCNWLGEKFGGDWRLPTEAEWEYAARGGNKSKGYTYAGSNDLESVAWFEDNAGGQTNNVSRKKPNELGIYDMSGNVWEWCKDWYAENYYSNNSNNNPRGPASGSKRVLRGGSYYFKAKYCNVASRNRDTPDFRSINFGFRVVLSQ